MRISDWSSACALPICVRELPLALNENQQYIHYNKGSVVFYALRDAIGEDTLNRILSGFLDKWAFKGPPYPTTRDFLADLYAGTDEKYHPLIHDMFEDRKSTRLNSSH